MKSKIKKEGFSVSEIKKETEDVITIFLSPINESFSFIAGQYMAIYLERDIIGPTKFYTISSSPDEKLFAFSIKKIGDYSSSLHSLKMGDNIYLSGPFGSFYPNQEMERMVFLSAGIGVTPFISIIKDYTNKRVEKQIDLFYSNKTFKDISFYEELNKISQINEKLKIHYFLTREKILETPNINYGRMNIEIIKDKIIDLNERSFYICGPDGFVLDLKNQLLEFGINEINIFTESFF